jgi:hypothetical protein
MSRIHLCNSLSAGCWLLDRTWWVESFAF